MTNPSDPKTSDEIEDWRVQEMCRAVLGASLLPSDSHEENDAGKRQPLMTDDEAWYFVPHYDDPVVRLRGPMVGGWNPPVHHMHRPRWAIEAVHHFPATREDPEDSDLAEVGRVDSLELAFAEVRHILLRQEIENICMGVHAQYESKIEPYWEDQRNEP